MKSRNIWFFWIGLIILLAGFFWVLKYQLEKYIAIKLPDWVAQSSDEKYFARISSIDFDIFPLGMQIYDVVIEPNNSADTNKIIVGLEAKTIMLSGFKLISYLKNQQIKFDKLETQNLKIKIWTDNKKLKNTKTKQNSKKDTSANDGIKFLSINKIRLGPAELLWQSKNSLSLQNLFINLDSLKYEKNTPLYIGKYSAKFDSLIYELPDGLHKASIQKFKLSKDNQITIKNLSVLPLIVNEKNFFKHVGYQTDRFELQNLNLNAYQLDLNKLFSSKALYIEKLELTNGRALIIRDKRYAKKLRPVPLLPMQMLKKMKVKLQIEHLNTSIPLIEYHEYDTKSQNPGIIKFENLWLHFDSLNTSKTAGQFAVLATARIQGRAKLNLKLNFDYKNPEYFRANGHVSRPFEASVFNSAAYPLGGIKISNGKINLLKFDFSGNSSATAGRLDLQYTNLQIQTSQIAIKQLPKVGHQLLSEITHKLIFKTSNPMPGEPIRIGKINHQRTQNSFLNFLWTSLFDGIKEAIDLPKIIKDKKPKQAKPSKK